MSCSSPAPQKGLLSLPDELLLEVINDLASLKDPWRPSSLCGLSLVNRRLHGLIKPYLYSTFSFHAGTPYLFLRTISQNEALASHVKVISWDYETSFKLFKYKPRMLAAQQQFKLNDVHEKLKQDALQGNSVAKQLMADLSFSRLYSGDLEALDVLLMFTPNVERLLVVETYQWDDHAYWFTPILRGGPDAFSRLTSATLHGPMRLENVAALLFLPSMRHLELTQVIEMRQEAGRPFEWESYPTFNTLVDQRTSNIEHLHLLDSYFDFVNFSRGFLRTIKRLRSLVYEHVHHELSIAWRSIDYRALGELLLYHRHSLTFLRISSGDSPVFQPTDLEELKILWTSVQKYTELIELELPYAYSGPWFQIPIWEELPANLEYLTLDCLIRIYDPDYPVAELEHKLEALAASKRAGQLPRLHFLKVTNWHPWYGTIPKNESQIRSVLESVGVRLSTMPAAIGSSRYTMEDIGWVELQSEPEWVLIEIFQVDEE